MSPWGWQVCHYINQFVLYALVYASNPSWGIRLSTRSSHSSSPRLRLELFPGTSDPFKFPSPDGVFGSPRFLLPYGLHSPHGVIYLLGEDTSLPTVGISVTWFLVPVSVAEGAFGSVSLPYAQPSLFSILATGFGAVLFEQFRKLLCWKWFRKPMNVTLLFIAKVKHTLQP